MNVLISCGGRQAFLVEAFRDALQKRGNVIVTDVDSSAPSLKVADKGIVAPPITSDKYISWLLNICKKEKINLLLTLNVDDLLKLEKYRVQISEKNCFLVGGDLKAIKKTYDKYKLNNFIKSLGLDIPQTYLLENITSETQFSFPVLAKPRFGKGSRGHAIVENKQALNSFVEKNNSESKESYIIQNYIEGPEYGLDLINDFHSEYSATLVRKKIHMKNGETFEAISESPKEWENLARKLSNGLNHQGTVDIDVIKSKGKIFVIDINHRFGGGYIFNHKAGANLPRAYIDWGLNSDTNKEYLTYANNVHAIRDGLSIKLAK